jgi:hypothetical protein
MIIKDEVAEDFWPDFQSEYSIKGELVKVGLRYKGPVPVVGAPVQMEITHYWVSCGDHKESGRIEWDPTNGALTYRHMEQALFMLWDPEKKKLRFNSE